MGGITGALVGMGIPEYEAKRYEGMVKEGRVLVSVHSDNAEETRRAKEIFERADAADIATAGEEGVPKERAAAGTTTRGTEVRTKKTTTATTTFGTNKGDRGCD